MSDKLREAAEELGRKVSVYNDDPFLEGKNSIITGLINELNDTLRAALSEQVEPYVWEYRVNYAHTLYSDEKPPEDAYDEGTLIPLYTQAMNEVNNPAPLRESQSEIALSDNDICSLLYKHFGMDAASTGAFDKAYAFADALLKKARGEAS